MIDYGNIACGLVNVDHLQFSTSADIILEIR